VKKMLLPIFMLFFLVSCATPEIRLDPNATEYKNRYTNIIGMDDLNVVSRIVRIMKQQEGKETIQLPEFIPEFSKVSLGDDTITVYAMIRVLNQNKVPYKIYEVYNIKRTLSEYSYQISHKLYDGSLSYNEFKVYAPANQDMEYVDIHFELRDNKDVVRDQFGHFSVSKAGLKGGQRDNWGSNPGGKNISNF